MPQMTHSRAYFCPNMVFFIFSNPEWRGVAGCAPPLDQPLQLCLHAGA